MVRTLDVFGRGLVSYAAAPYSLLLTFIESMLLSDHVHDYLDDDEYVEFQFHVAANPKARKLVRGSGGVRKIRWPPPGTGKSGGVRVIYFARTHRGEIWLLTLHSKSAKDKIPGHVSKALKQEFVDEAK